MNALAAWAAASVLNALWQTALVFCAAWLAAKLVRPAGARAAHRVWVSALVLEVLLPFCRMRPEIWWASLLAALKSAGSGSVTVHLEADRLGGTTHPWLPGWAQTALAAFLLLALGVAAVRLTWNLWRTRDLLRRAEPFIPPSEFERLLASSAEALGVDRAQVTVARLGGLPGPATLGCRRHTILLPTDLMDAGFSGKEREELAAVLAHELVHIRRKDFARNLLYELISLPIAWHPLLVLTRSQVNETRELTVDAEAAAFLAGDKTYARSLVRIAARLAMHPVPRPNVAMGLCDNNIFERRIVNLMRNSAKISRGRWAATVTACLLLALGTAFAAMALQTDVQPDGTVKDGVATLSPGHAAQNLISKVAPNYPVDAKKAGIQGTVVLAAVIGKDGQMENLRVVSGPPELQESALDAVKQWVYKPYLLNGKPVEVETKINVTYSLSDRRPAAAGAMNGESAQKVVDGATIQPKLIKSVDAAYPPDAKLSHMEGLVKVSTRIDDQGRPHVLGVEGPEAFWQSAKAAVEQYTFEPAIRDGKHVEATMLIDVSFRIY